MSALPRIASAARTQDAAQIALLGVGTVGGAFLERVARLRTALPALRLVHVASSRRTLRGRIDAIDAQSRLAAMPELARVDVLDAFDGGAPSIIIDATGSDDVAARHAQWLAQGANVVTASKLGQGASLSRWHAIDRARRAAATHYGDSASVGAGLPVLRSLRRLRGSGDAIHDIGGVLSGSMAWLFSEYDGRRPFSGFVRRARNAGYTEPDPREDLSGEDVRRKLLILARAAGFAIDVEDVVVESLVPTSLASIAPGDLDGALSMLDGPLRERFSAAYRRGERLRHVARFECRRGRAFAHVGIESLSADDPLAAGQGTDNRVAIRSDRYRDQPLVIQGPGAGAAVTAAALLDDVLEIVARCG